MQKSTEWKYEEEFRSVFCSDWLYQLENNGSSLSLKNDEISDIYFGMNMENEHKAKITELINDGPFNPKFWDTQASKVGFDLDFKEHI